MDVEQHLDDFLVHLRFGGPVFEQVGEVFLGRFEVVVVEVVSAQLVELVRGERPRPVSWNVIRCFPSPSSDPETAIRWVPDV
jgi:hypothetical protein